MGAERYPDRAAEGQLLRVRKRRQRQQLRRLLLRRRPATHRGSEQHPTHSSQHDQRLQNQRQHGPGRCEPHPAGRPALRRRRRQAVPGAGELAGLIEGGLGPVRRRNADIRHRHRRLRPRGAGPVLRL